MANKKDNKNSIDMANINKELESKKAEILKELDSKIESKVDAVINEKIKDYEKKIVRSKNYKIIKRDIVIILLLGLIIYAGYYMYKNDYFGINDKIDNTVDNSIDIVELDSSYYIKNYHYLVDNIFIEDIELLDIFKKDTTSSNDISNSLKLKISYFNIKNKQTDDGNIIFSKDDLLSSYKTIFNDEVINNQTFTYNNTRFIYYNNMYIGYVMDNDNINIKYDIYNSYVKEDNLVFEVVVGRVIDNNIISVYDDSILEYNGNIKDYVDRLSKYSFTFKNIQDKYYFNRLDRIS